MRGRNAARGVWHEVGPWVDTSGKNGGDEWETRLGTVVLLRGLVAIRLFGAIVGVDYALQGLYVVLV